MIVVLVVLALAIIAQQILHARERAELLDRIQAPQRVIDRRSPEPSDEPLSVVPDDDEAWAQYEEDRAAGRAI